MEKQVKDFALSHNLIIYCLKESVCQINVRENHPILNDFSKERLWNYPFIDFINQRPGAIKLSKLITILCVVRLLVKLMLFQLESQ